MYDGEAWFTLKVEKVSETNFIQLEEAVGDISMADIDKYVATYTKEIPEKQKSNISKTDTNIKSQEK